MTYSSLPRYLLLLVAVFLSAAQAAADTVPWSYSASPAGQGIVFSSDALNAGSVVFYGETGSQNTASARITLTQLGIAFYDRIPGQDNGATFDQVSYGLDLSLRDGASGAAGTLSFTGFFDGGFDKKSILLNNTFTGLTTQSLTLGANVYTVNIGPYTSPGLPGSPTLGSIEADVTVQPHGGPHDSPEPSGLVLAWLGLSSLGLGAWRRWASRRLPQ